MGLPSIFALGRGCLSSYAFAGGRFPTRYAAWYGRATRRARLTLSGTFFWLTAGTLVAVGILLSAFLAASQRSILESADELRIAAAERVELAVASDLGVARKAVQNFEPETRLGVIKVDDPTALEKALFASLVDAPTLSEVAFTRAAAAGYDDRGDLIVGPEDRWELGVYRTATPARVVTRRTQLVSGAWTARVRERAAGEPVTSGLIRDGGPAEDPTGTATFEVAAAKEHSGRPLWSDLHWCRDLQVRDCL